MRKKKCRRPPVELPRYPPPKREVDGLPPTASGRRGAAGKVACGAARPREECGPERAAAPFFVRSTAPPASQSTTPPSTHLMEDASLAPACGVVGFGVGRTGGAWAMRAREAARDHTERTDATRQARGRARRTRRRARPSHTARRSARASSMPIESRVRAQGGGAHTGDARSCLAPVAIRKRKAMQQHARPRRVSTEPSRVGRPCIALSGSLPAWLLRVRVGRGQLTARARGRRNLRHRPRPVDPSPPFARARAAACPPPSGSPHTHRGAARQRDFFLEHRGVVCVRVCCVGVDCFCFSRGKRRVHSRACPRGPHPHRLSPLPPAQNQRQRPCPFTSTPPRSRPHPRRRPSTRPGPSSP
jgi:hypothetical protein